MTLPGEIGVLAIVVFPGCIDPAAGAAVPAAAAAAAATTAVADDDDDAAVAEDSGDDRGPSRTADCSLGGRGPRPTTPWAGLLGRPLDDGKERSILNKVLPLARRIELIARHDSFRGRRRWRDRPQST